ncbi:MAG: YmL10 [Alyxoria varia]|nr:MAG: YmL10 [Alyxoria varia]
MAVSASRNFLLSYKSISTHSLSGRLYRTTKVLSCLHLDRPRHFSQAHVRPASILGSLSDNPGAYSKRIRRGRGPASGKGKTSGRGHKGQKQHGKVPAGFNGGETSAEVAKGKRGFVNEFALDMTPINLDRIQLWIDQGRLDPTRPITMKELSATRCVHGIKDGIKLLARNVQGLRSAIHITVSRASSSAIAAVEACGGSVTTRYYTRPSIKRILRGQSHPILSRLSQPPPQLESPAAQPSQPPNEAEDTEQLAAPASHLVVATYGPSEAYRYRLPDPAARANIEYYRDPAHRGYLSYQVETGETPSLFFKKPRAIANAERKAAGLESCKEDKKIKSSAQEGSDTRVRARERLW